MRAVVRSWRKWGSFGLGLVLLAATVGCGGGGTKFCYWETVGNSNRDAFVPWWTLDGGGDGGQGGNACGGESVLAVEPGTPCGSCGGQFVCDGPDSVRCEDPCIETMGCADGEREGFTDATAFPNIAACAGGWTEPGILDVQPSCQHIAGDDSVNPAGLGCSAADLCAEGWHVCDSPEDVARSSPAGCRYPWEDGVFYAAAVSGDGGGTCTQDGTNDLIGCGSAGSSADSSCTPLNRTSGDKCGDLPDVWVCPGGLFGSETEAEDVKKDGPEGGGVLCCRDQGL